MRRKCPVLMTDLGVGTGSDGSSAGKSCACAGRDNGGCRCLKLLARSYSSRVRFCHLPPSHSPLMHGAVREKERSWDSLEREFCWVFYQLFL